MPLRHARRYLWSVVCLVVVIAVAPFAAAGVGFQPVNPDELKMTSEPQAPGAPAVILYRQVDRDDNGHTSHQDDYIRIKILTEEGRKYADIEIPFFKDNENIVNIRARSIRPDGTIANFDGKEPRKFPIEFAGPVKDTDSFEIALPDGYEVDDVPPAVDAEYSFASYHSKTEVKGNVISYTRTFEVKELSVPVNQADDLRKFYRIIASDERNTAVLKPLAK
jgi:Domain of Unknown Function with PDB structure (DUF3857)